MNIIDETQWVVLHKGDENIEHMILEECVVKHKKYKKCIKMSIKTLQFILKYLV